MAKKIFLSPSNQTDNRYAAGNTTEANQCGLIAQAAEKMLKRCGFDVKLLHYYDMATKVKVANDWNADLYVPIHTNAFNRKVGGTRIFYYAENGEGHKAAKCVYKYLKPLSPGTSDNITPNPELYEVKYPEAPTVYVEAEFHDNAEYADWIIDNINPIAEAITKGICEHFGVKFVEEPKPTIKPAEEVLYRVQVGAFSKRENAEKLLAKLKEVGIEGYIRT